MGESASVELPDDIGILISTYLCLEVDHLEDGQTKTTFQMMNSNASLAAFPRSLLQTTIWILKNITSNDVEGNPTEWKNMWTALKCFCVAIQIDDAEIQEHCCWGLGNIHEHTLERYEMRSS